jgi:uncharacterized protein (TIGR02001 family)
MKQLGSLVVAAVALSATSAFAADMPVKASPAPVVATPSAWDIAFGAAVMSDYNFRGISQSDRGPAAFAYFEPRFNINKDVQLYAGIAGTSVDLATRPGAEIDLYAGIRPTFGDFAFDFGGIYYLYPNETAITVATATPPAFNTTLANTDFWEVYAKVAWTISPVLTLGANIYYSPDWLATGADGTYASGTAKITAPATMMPTDIGAYLSGEFGHYWLGTTNLVPGVFVSNSGTQGWNLPDYNYWNLGVGFTYKVFTLDLRYHDTDLTKAECNALTADPGASGGVTVINNFTTTGKSNWCGAAFIAKLSFDLTLANLK